MTTPWYCKTCNRHWPQTGFHNKPCPFCGSDKIRPVTPASPAP